jgi:hypothetical protein
LRVPEHFEHKLEREFRGRLRIRWSNQRHEFQIEQRVRRSLAPGWTKKKKDWDESSDDYIRHRDGYVLILSVRVGTKMPCPRCQTELSVPFNETKNIVCHFCQLQGRSPHIAAMHVPLNDTLIDYLKKIDPENPISERLNEDLERQNAALAASMEQAAVNAGVAGFEERYRRIAGIPLVGYTGREHKWVK